ncbi:hypothetical protein AND_002318 [Anopheles darlingi]|uniref:Secreted protein n=1 Tax=Anopheles darlingi TaxID=43151 RepID=W5JRM5_ANODA|nr:hypothetical protein AND_002318 [Anopheles darlingi]
MRSLVAASLLLIVCCLLSHWDFLLAERVHPRHYGDEWSHFTSEGGYEKLPHAWR